MGGVGGHGNYDMPGALRTDGTVTEGYGGGVKSSGMGVGYLQETGEDMTFQPKKAITLTSDVVGDKAAFAKISANGLYITQADIDRNAGVIRSDFSHASGINDMNGDGRITQGDVARMAADDKGNLNANKYADLMDKFNQADGDGNGTVTGNEQVFALVKPDQEKIDIKVHMVNIQEEQRRRWNQQPQQQSNGMDCPG